MLLWVFYLVSQGVDRHWYNSLPDKAINWSLSVLLYIHERLTVLLSDLTYEEEAVDTCRNDNYSQGGLRHWIRGCCELIIKTCCDLTERFPLCLITQGGSHSLSSKLLHQPLGCGKASDWDYCNTRVTTVGNNYSCVPFIRGLRN